MKDLPYLYALDIETTGLNPWKNHVTTISIYSPQASIVLEDTNEKRLLNNIQEWLCSQPKGLMCSWNGAIFDFPWLQARMKVNQVSCKFILELDPTIVPKYPPLPGFKGGYSVVVVDKDEIQHTHIDTAFSYQAWSEKNGIHWGLKPVAKANGIKIIEVDRTKMDKLTIPERMSYNLSDVVATWELTYRLLNKKDTNLPT